MKGKNTAPPGSKPKVTQQSAPTQRPIGMRTAKRLFKEHLEKPLPEPYLVSQNLPAYTPPITEKEITAYLNARHKFLAARADWEQKRAAIVYRLTLGSPVDLADVQVSLEDDGDTLVAREQGPAIITVDRR
jgi:hypothetical protein